MSAGEGADPPFREWALIAYLCGDNPQLAAHIRRQVDAILAYKGSAFFHVAVQWDLPDGAQRAVLAGGTAWEIEPLGRVNTGDPEAFFEFLRWAFDRCPARQLMVVVSGTGLLDPRASFGGPETDRAHLFTICDDATAGDALSLSEVGPMFRKAVDASARDRIDILAFDLRELQCLEVAYELEGIVDVLIAPQTRVPDSGWNFEVVLAECDAILGKAQPLQPVSPADLARLLVQTVGAAYEATRQGHLSLSALNLQTLKNFASAFDTLSLAMVHSVGEELVWEARAAVARKLKPQAGSRAAPGAPNAAPDAAEMTAEVEYLYDLLELLEELRTELAAAGRAGLLRLVIEHLNQRGFAAFERAIESIDGACFTSGSRLRTPKLAASIRDPGRVRRQLRNLLENVGQQSTAWVDSAAPRREALTALFTAPELKPPENHSWLDGWPETTIAALEPPLRAVYTAALGQQQRLKHLAAMTDRVLLLLKTGTRGAGQSPVEPLVLAHFMSAAEAPSRHGGVSLYRPRDLDQLIASDYLKLKFNKKIHWTVLLAVINLIGNHPRALWRILSALLATADNNTRAQLIDRITGPGSVIASFREQFVVLAPVKAYVLSLEPDPDETPSSAAAKPGSTVPGPSAYRVRLELAEREAFISEFRSVVDPDALQGVIDGLVELLEPGTALTAADAKRIESLGETLGEDILQELGVKLTDASQSPDQIHLQLQIPRELMKYPWELMHYKDGWLSEHFAMGRQVFSRMGGGVMRSRIPGPLRVLIIGNPRTKERPLAYAAQEAEEIANSFAALAAETDGLLDFNRDRDALINAAVTRDQLRELLRHGNYDIVHFAGHAAYNPERPGSSAWLLTDGRLSAQAIRNTLRWRDTQPWLVYANACEAGMDGAPPKYQSDVFGLASAFLDHGVSVFIGPLWPIDDRIAAGIARTFYEQLLKERQTVGEALRYAKAEAKHGRFDPIVRAAEAGRDDRVAMVSWTGLVLYGNSTATFGQRVGAPPPPEPRKARGRGDDD